MKLLFAEMPGTFLLLFIGCAAIVTGGTGGALPLGQFGIGLAVGLGLVAAAYVIGPISGAHLDPAVTPALPCRAAAGEGRRHLLDRPVRRRHPTVALQIMVTGKVGGIVAKTDVFEKD